jgi:hypothetical protein
MDKLINLDLITKVMHLVNNVAVGHKHGLIVVIVVAINKAVCNIKWINVALMALIVGVVQTHIAFRQILKVIIIEISIEL